MKAIPYTDADAAKAPKFAVPGFAHKLFVGQVGDQTYIGDVYFAEEAKRIELCVNMHEELVGFLLAVATLKVPALAPGDQPLWDVLARAQLLIKKLDEVN